MTFGVKDYTTEAPKLQPPVTQSAEQQFDRAEFNRSGFKDLAAEDRSRASSDIDITVVSSTSTLTQEVWVT